MSYIDLRNRDHVFAITARADAADLKNGMQVKFSGTTTNGTLKVIKATAADLADPSVKKGIVWYRPDDNLAVDFDMDPTGVTMTPIAKLIPQNAQVTVLTGRMVVAYHNTLLPADLVAAGALAKVSFDGDTALPALVASGATDGTQVQVGVLERIDGPEVTLILSV